MRCTFDVIIEVVGARKFDVIQQVRRLTGLDMKEAKALVEAVPAMILTNASIEDAASAKEALVRAGAVVALE